MSIKLRLTLLYSTIVALTLVLFSAVLYLTLARWQLSSVQQTLTDESQRLINTAYKSDSGTLSLPASKVTAVDTYAQLRNSNGAPISNEFGRSRNLREAELNLPLPRSEVETIQSEGTSQTIHEMNGQRFMIMNRLFEYRDVTFILQVGRSLAEQDRTLQTLARMLLIGTALATLTAFGVGWVLAGTTLRPIDRVTQTADTIGRERNFDRRVEYHGPNDEIGRLVTTFNSMLAALREAYRQQAQALQAQRRFVADASHELRTPLTTIRGNLGLLQRTPPISNSDRDDVIADMVDETERMSRLVHDLLTLARADAGRQLRIEAIVLQPLLDDIYRSARALDSYDRLRWNSTASAEIRGDSDALKQVLLILMDNALKFTPPTGSVVLAAETAHTTATISVADTGPGISAEALPHIFERFYRGDASRTGSGAGLGLAIAKALVEAMHGTLDVTSAPGSGTTFRVQLPLERVLDQDEVTQDTTGLKRLQHA